MSSCRAEDPIPGEIAKKLETRYLPNKFKLNEKRYQRHDLLKQLISLTSFYKEKWRNDLERLELQKLKVILDLRIFHEESLKKEL